MIERQGARLLHLVEDVLDLQHTMGEDKVDLRPVDLRTVLDEVARVQAATGRTVRVRAPAQLPVNGDRAALERVFTNLVDNAFEHGKGDVEVVAQSVRDDDGPAVEVAVTDEGPGVPENERTRIFERFLRGRDAFTPGMGLGLYLVRTLVSAHGGRVWVGDRPGGGASFHVVLPAPPEDNVVYDVR